MDTLLRGENTTRRGHVSHAFMSMHALQSMTLVVSRALSRLALLYLFSSLLAGPAYALDTIPLYEPISIGAMIRSVYPTAGISSAARLNSEGDAVGRVIIDNQYHAFVYTEAHGVQLLPPLGSYTSHVAVDVTDRDVDGRILIVGSAQTLYGDPDRAVLWVYDTSAGAVVETIEIGVPSGADWSTATAVNNNGLVVGYARAVGWMTPYQPFAYDYTTRFLHELAIPFNPVDINNSKVITGGTYRAELVYVDTLLQASNLEDLRTADRPSVTRTTALNESNEVIGVTSMGYSDGAGRIVAGAVRYVNPAGPWEVLWANSAYDTANGINIAGDVVGSTGVSAAIRPFVYIEALGQGFLVIDLVDPSLPPAYADYGANDINDQGDIVAGASSAVLFKWIGDMPPPTAPGNLTAVTHEPTWTQPWNAITISWQNTSAFTRTYSIERSVSGADS